MTYASKTKAKLDKSVDLTSNKFDAYTALYSDGVEVPDPKAPALDNLTKFSEVDGIIAPTTSKGIPISQAKTKVPGKGNLKQKSLTSGKRFLPHQEPIPGRAKRVARNVLSRMSNVKGPLALLQRCMNDRIRIKVVTRNMAGIRGHCMGYLAAFDKHFNMALEDVVEVWTRRKHSKIPPLGAGENWDVPQPRVRVRSSTPKTEECERFVSKLLMRGEHVVSVIASDHLP